MLFSDTVSPVSPCAGPIGEKIQTGCVQCPFVLLFVRRTLHVYTSIVCNSNDARACACVTSRGAYTRKKDAPHTKRRTSSSYSEVLR